MNSMHPTVKKYNSDSSVCERKILICVICGATARGYNFGAITCMSCKIFFRRNALTNLNRFVCQQSGTCEINEQTRRHCTYCRLVMCFRVGMKKELIRKSRDPDTMRNPCHYRSEYNGTIYDQRDYQKVTYAVESYPCSNSSDSSSSTPIVSHHDWSIFTRLSVIFDSLAQQVASKAYEMYESLSCMSIQPLKVRIKASYIYDMQDIINLAGLNFLRTIPQISLSSIDVKQYLYLRHARVFLMYYTHYQMNLDSISKLTRMPCWISLLDCLLLRSTNRLFQQVNLYVGRIHSIDPYLTQLILLTLAFTCTSINPEDHRYQRWSSESDEYHSIVLISRIQHSYVNLMWNYMLHRFGEAYAMSLYPFIISTILHIQQLVSMMEKSELSSERKFDENLKTCIDRIAQYHWN